LDLKDYKLEKVDDKYYLIDRFGNTFGRIGYDKVIRCLGFTFDFSLFDNR